jgi:ankyrin repeat protein
LEVVNLLLADERIDVNAQDTDLCTAFHAATLNRKYSVMHALQSDERVEVNGRFGKLDIHILQDLNTLRDIEAMKIFIACDRCDVNIESSCGMTPLFIAIQHSTLDILNMLLECPRIKVDARFSGGHTALMVAAEVRDIHVSYVKALLAHGADPNAVTYRGRTVASFATHSDKRDLLMKAAEETADANYVLK